MSKEKQSKHYDESNVKNISGLKSVRAKPGMYIGDTTPSDAWTLVREKADNTVDEGLAGRNSVCYIHIGEDGTHCVADYGQGIPVGNIKVEDPVTHKTHNISALKGIVSLLHTGAKFDDEAYKISRGTHGIGIKATNALSSLFQVYTCYKGKWYFTEYKKGIETVAVKRVKKPPKLPNGKRPKRGTVMFSKADPAIFTEGTKFSPRLAFDWAKVTAYLVPKFRIIVEGGKGKRKVFYFENGPHDYVKDKIKDLGCSIIGETFYATTPLVDVALAFTDAAGQQTNFYTNGLHNSEGGVHANSTYSALHTILQEFAKRGRNTFSVADIKEGLLGLVNVKLSTPRFTGQTKQKLSDPRAKKPLEDVIVNELRKFFKKHRDMADAICVRATEIHGINSKHVLDKAAARALKAVQRLGFPEKFAYCPRAKPEERETYFVEGESAGGTAKQARDKKYQEVLPMKGKILNCIRKADSTVIASEEVKHLLAAIGYDPSAPDPYKKLRTHKIIGLCDPDYDGYHINGLVLALLYKYLPKLFELGYVYLVDAPAYYAVNHKTEEYFTGNTVEEVQKKAYKGAHIHHLKGWGECPVTLLEPLAFSPKTRKLIQISSVDKQGHKDFFALMGEDPSYRKELLGV